VVWIIEKDKNIVDSYNLQARSNYIQNVTGTKVSPWASIQVNGQIFIYCTSDDYINGIFITAHIQNVYTLCLLRKIYINKFIVANTCIWERMLPKKILHTMRKFNKNIDLWFSKQDISLECDKIFRHTTTINDIGMFGFKTSLSERKLFKNRKNGLFEAMKMSFDQVSPILLLGE
jgi:hypothetical protein